MQRGFQDDVPWFDDIQHVAFHLWVIHANQFLIEGNRQGRLPTEFRHISPLPLSDGLLDTMDGILREKFEFIQSLFVGKGSIGIKS